MRIAVEGCAHGELEIIYESISEVEKIDGRKIDLLICCGDFQATRNLGDLKCMAVPDKYKDMCTFYKYYSGEKLAPVLTIFIGGNHEASNYLQELPYGGWVAPNIFYLGYASVVNVRGVRIAGISGIYKGHNWMQGHFEKPPYTNDTMRSVYHIRNLESFRLKQLSGVIDIFLSHDWPRGITKYGDENALLRNKPFFKNDIDSNSLGSPPCMELLEHHHPHYWFSAHLHCKFAALVPAENGSRITKFLALDKCLPRRKFLQVLDIDHDDSLPLELSYDLEWLSILFLTNHLLSVKSGRHYMPGPCGNGRWLFTPTGEEKDKILLKFNGDLRVPKNFKVTAKPYDPDASSGKVEQPELRINEQTTTFCNKLGIDDPSGLLQMLGGNVNVSSKCDGDESSGNVSLGNSFESNDASSVSFVSESPSGVLFDEDSVGGAFHGISRIALPSPRNNSDLVDLEEESSDKEAYEEKAGCEEKPNEEVPQTDISKAPCDNGDTPLEAEPNCKKFKRRNYSMYSDTL